jgi:hypothetical protein
VALNPTNPRRCRWRSSAILLALRRPNTHRYGTTFLDGEEDDLEIDDLTPLWPEWLTHRRSGAHSAGGERPDDPNIASPNSDDPWLLERITAEYFDPARRIRLPPRDLIGRAHGFWVPNAT